MKNMTRSEAIEHLETIAIYSVQDGYTDEARQALDMAIKALEESERKTGRWIDKKYRWIKSISMWWYSAYKCSICDEAGIKDWNFCPNCGADMRNAAEIARDIVHEAIDHTTWSDTVNVEEMHRVVDNKYADMRGIEK